MQSVFFCRCTSYRVILARCRLALARAVDQVTVFQSFLLVCSAIPNPSGLSNSNGILYLTCVDLISRFFLISAPFRATAIFYCQGSRSGLGTLNAALLRPCGYTIPYADTYCKIYFRIFLASTFCTIPGVSICALCHGKNIRKYILQYVSAYGIV